MSVTQHIHFVLQNICKRSAAKVTHHMMDMSYGERHRLMGMITKQHRRGVVASNTYCIVALTTGFCLMQPLYQLLDHNIHTFQVLHLQKEHTLIHMKSQHLLISMSCPKYSTNRQLRTEDGSVMSVRAELLCKQDTHLQDWLLIMPSVINCLDMQKAKVILSRSQCF